jgi:radical SAM protein with 4Fe4S-binding SPASM domain
MLKFRKTYIEITNACNLSCSFCPRTSRSPGFMTAEQFTEVLRKIKGHSERLYLHVLGEPLLHPQLGDFLDMCDRPAYKVTLVTNGTLIEKSADILNSKPALRQINFSLHSFNANENSLTQGSYLDAIFTFVHASESRENLMISLRLWNNSKDGKENKNQQILKRIQQEFNLDTLPFDPQNPFAGIKIGKNVFVNQAAEFVWPALNRPEIPGAGFCLGLRDQLAVLVDGTVVPCCLDAEGGINLGNIFKQDLENILQSTRAQKLYHGFSKREVIEGLCRRCSYRLRFK